MNEIENYGADSLRMTICFMGPYDETYPWNPNIIKTINKLIRNIYSLEDKVSNENTDETIIKAYNVMVKNVSEMLENLKTNTCISEIMIFVKKLQKAQYISKDVWLGFLRILAPFAPFVAEELWQNTNNYSGWKKENSVHLQPWPDYDKKYTEYKIITIPVQINGKVRSEIKIDKEAEEEEIKKAALSDEKVAKHLDGRNVKKWVYVKNKVINIVI